VPHQLVHFLEASLVEQEIDTLAGGKLALGMLPLAPFLAPTRLGVGMPPPHLGQPVV
jgi:hypothetical protein